MSETRLTRKPNNKFALSLRKMTRIEGNPEGFPNFVCHATDEGPANCHFDTASLGLPLCLHRYTGPSRYCMVLMRPSPFELIKLNPFASRNYNIIIIIIIIGTTAPFELRPSSETSVSCPYCCIQVLPTGIPIRNVM